MPDNDGNLKYYAKYLNDIFLNYKMKQIVERKTYPQNNENTDSILDLVVVKNNLINEIEVIPNIHKNCDHFALNIKILIKKSTNTIRKSEIRIFNDKIVNSINNDMIAVEWGENNSIIAMISMKYIKV